LKNIKLQEFPVSIIKNHKHSNYRYYTLKDNLSHININPYEVCCKNASAANITVLDLNEHKRTPDKEFVWSTIHIALHIYDCELEL
jgi:hypothetical protein